MDTLAHVGFLITILCLIYIYQDYSIYRTYQAHQGMFFKSFYKKVWTNNFLVQSTTRKKPNMKNRYCVEETNEIVGKSQKIAQYSS